MVNLTKSTESIKEKEIRRDWHLIDVKGKVLGRSATKIAALLMGKEKTNYVTYLDMGDNVVVINTSEVKVTGNKGNDKMYSRYSGFPGGLTKKTFNEVLKTTPKELIRHAVSGMLPKNKHRDQRLARLHIYTDGNHPFAERFEKKSK